MAAHGQGTRRTPARASWRGKARLWGPQARARLAQQGAWAGQAGRRWRSGRRLPWGWRQPCAACAACTSAPRHQQRAGELRRGCLAGPVPQPAAMPDLCRPAVRPAVHEAAPNACTWNTVQGWREGAADVSGHPARAAHCCLVMPDCAMSKRAGALTGDAPERAPPSVGWPKPLPKPPICGGCAWGCALPSCCCCCCWPGGLKPRPAQPHRGAFSQAPSSKEGAGPGRGRVLLSILSSRTHGLGSWACLLGASGETCCQGGPIMPCSSELKPADRQADAVAAGSRGLFLQLFLPAPVQTGWPTSPATARRQYGAG